MRNRVSAWLKLPAALVLAVPLSPLAAQAKTPTLTVAPPQIKSVTVHVNGTPPKCPASFEFHGVILLTRKPATSVTVTYQWIRSDGATTPTEHYTMKGDSLAVHTTWNLGGPGAGTLHEWEQLQVTLGSQSVKSSQSAITAICPKKE